MSQVARIKKGDAVVVVEGIHKGAEGTVDDVFRAYDKDSQTTAWRITIEVPGDGESNYIETRLAWVRGI